MTYSTRHSDFAASVDALEKGLDKTSRVAGDFTNQMGQVTKSFAQTSKQVSDFEKTLSSGFKRAIDGMLLDGKSFADVLRGIGKTIINQAYKDAISPISEPLSAAFAKAIGSVLPFANGAAFSQGRVQPFANGGIVGAPTHFAMRGGQTGLMGEAGPEAIMPLARGADGKLGVRAGSSAQARPISVVFNISTPDVAGFNRTQSQIAGKIGQAIAQAQRHGY